jgi:hypothetical protein
MRQLYLRNIKLVLQEKVMISFSCLLNKVNCRFFEATVSGTIILDEIKFCSIFAWYWVIRQRLDSFCVFFHTVAQPGLVFRGGGGL